MSKGVPWSGAKGAELVSEGTACGDEAGDEAGDDRVWRKEIGGSPPRSSGGRDMATEV